MADDTREKNGGPELFRLGRRYDEVTSNLGQLHQSWHLPTGRPALTLLPESHVDWAPSEPCEALLVFAPGQGSVSLVPWTLPPSLEMEQVANLFTLMTAGLARVEDNPQVRAHLASAKRPRGWCARSVAAGAGVAALVLLGLGLWLNAGDMSAPALPTARASESGPEERAPTLGDSDPEIPSALAYPLPSKPFMDQAAAPCRPDLGEEELNGGCWLELGKRPPCLKVHAEHQGKCFLPVSKTRGRTPRSAQP